MRQLYLIRHAETANRLLHQTDFDRILTAKGVQDAQRLGQYLTQYKVERILYSDAMRTTQTVVAINDSLQLHPETLVKSPVVYHADVATLLALIQSIEDRVHFVALVAHNPCISVLASVLSVERIPTLAPAQAVALAFDVDSWQKVAPECGHLQFVYKPDAA